MASTSGSTRLVSSRPPAGELGNAARVPVAGPDFVNSDFSVIKQFGAALAGRHGFELPRRVFQPRNHPSTAPPIADINEGSLFGKVNSTVNNPRLVQLALKLSF